jgi:hypothetical protein
MLMAQARTLGGIPVNQTRIPSEELRCPAGLTGIAPFPRSANAAAGAQATGRNLVSAPAHAPEPSDPPRSGPSARLLHHGHVVCTSVVTSKTSNCLLHNKRCGKTADSKKVRQAQDRERDEPGTKPFAHGYRGIFCCSPKRMVPDRFHHGENRPAHIRTVGHCRCDPP